MIRGIGTDITDIGRVARLLTESSAGRFLDRVLTAKERELLEGRRGRAAEFVAGRFAAKEAVAKALGCGIGNKLRFMDIEIVPDELGKPVCRISRRSQEMLSWRSSDQLHITISHGDQHAVAFAVWESNCRE